MPVSIIYAYTTQAEAVALPHDAGEISPGGQSSVIDTYIRHTGTAKITNCQFYILPYSAGVYLGAETAQEDYDLLIEWGDASTPAVTGGGLYVNMNHSGSFPSANWQVFYTGGGDTLGTAFDLPTTALSTGSGVAGEIPALGEAHLQWRLDPPAAYTGTGTGYIDTLMYYESTS